MKYFIGLILFCLLKSTSVIAQPLDDIVERRLISERRTLAYQPLREADIFWERRIWRVIDVREKMNQPFAYPEMPLFDIFKTAALAGDLPLYSPENDRFTMALSPEDIQATLFHQDTIEVVDPETLEPELKVINDEINVANIKRFRVRESWFFDEKIGQMRVRILGIAPLIEEYDDDDNFKFERALFWVHYPSCRDLLANFQVFNTLNDSSLMTWEDIFEMRYFSSYIYKASNVRGDRIKDYKSGMDQLLEADKIKEELFDFEHDLWSY
jgi:gliding motility associated protien GldN